MVDVVILLGGIVLGIPIGYAIEAYRRYRPPEEPAKVETAAPHKFRIRTAEADLNRHATTRKARIRAIRYGRPGPRR